MELQPTRSWLGGETRFVSNHWPGHLTLRRSVLTPTSTKNTVQMGDTKLEYVNQNPSEMYGRIKELCNIIAYKHTKIEVVTRLTDGVSVENYKLLLTARAGPSTTSRSATRSSRPSWPHPSSASSATRSSGTISPGQTSASAAVVCCSAPGPASSPSPGSIRQVTCRPSIEAHWKDDDSQKGLCEMLVGLVGAVSTTLRAIPAVGPASASAAGFFGFVTTKCD